VAFFALFVNSKIGLRNPDSMINADSLSYALRNQVTLSDIRIDIAQRK